MSLWAPARGAALGLRLLEESILPPANAAWQAHGRARWRGFELSTCPALLLLLRPGVPVLTLAGRCHAHNVGSSLLGAVGLGDEWVAHSGERRHGPLLPLPPLPPLLLPMGKLR